MKIYKIILFLFTIVALNSCSKDDNTIAQDPFVVAFENLSANLGTLGNNADIPLVYSTTSTSSGEIVITITNTNAVYGTDYTTTPEAIDNRISLDITNGTNGNSFTFNKLNDGLDETTEITFTITELNYPNAVIQGNTVYTINSEASLGRGYKPNVGGPNEPNQVYIDLSTETETLVQRDSWDLGFYGGSDFRVGINGSIYMAAAKLQSTNIDAVSQNDVADLQDQVAVGTFDPANEDYIDFPDGDITKSAIDPISSNNSENNVYLVNLGFEVGRETPAPGSAAVAGGPRGWKKIRVLRDGNNYILQYANLNDTTHQEVTISKNENFNFTFFSFNTNSVVDVEPEANSWDITFTVFTNVLPGAGSYGFADGVLHNRKGNVRAYEVLTNQSSYTDFNASNVDASQFQLDQRAIGDKWRDVFEGTAFDDRFYILQDPNGNLYKLRFLALTNDNGERGFPEFEYKLLQ